MLGCQCRLIDSVCFQESNNRRRSGSRRRVCQKKTDRQSLADKRVSKSIVADRNSSAMASRNASTENVQFDGRLRLGSIETRYDNGEKSSQSDSMNSFSQRVCSISDEVHRERQRHCYFAAFLRRSSSEERCSLLSCEFVRRFSCRSVVCRRILFPVDSSFLNT